MDLVDKEADVINKFLPIFQNLGNVLYDIASKAIDVRDKFVNRVIDIPFKPIRKAQETGNNNLKCELNTAIKQIQNVEI